MKRRLLSVVAICMALCMTPINAGIAFANEGDAQPMENEGNRLKSRESFVVDDIYYTVETDTKNVTVGYTQLYGADISTDDAATRNQRTQKMWGIENLVIPDTVTYNDCTYNVVAVGTNSLGTVTGSGSTALKSVTIPASVERIDDGAFAYCSNLEQVNIIDKGQAFSIGDMAFYYAGTANGFDIKLPAEFQMNTKTSYPKDETQIFALSGVRNIDFSACKVLSRINSWTFYGCNNLEKIDLTNCTSLSIIGAAAFANCGNLTEVNIH